MEKQLQNNKRVFTKKEDEKILVVERKRLFKDEVFNGIKKIDFDEYQKLIEENKQFLWRSKMETDVNFKQIIPYLVFCFNDQLFLMKRKRTAGDARLKNKYSLGIGGHIREMDIGSSSIFNWAKREFEEEVNYLGDFKIEPIGLLNDESDFVGQVHTGFIFLLRGDSQKISIKDEHQEGYLLKLDECEKFYDQMESWSKFCFDYLRDNFFPKV